MLKTLPIANSTVQPLRTQPSRDSVASAASATSAISATSVDAAKIEITVRRPALARADATRLTPAQLVARNVVGPSYRPPAAARPSAFWSDENVDATSQQRGAHSWPDPQSPSARSTVSPSSSLAANCSFGGRSASFATASQASDQPAGEAVIEYGQAYGSPRSAIVWATSLPSAAAGSDWPWLSASSTGSASRRSSLLLPQGRRELQRSMVSPSTSIGAVSGGWSDELFPENLVSYWSASDDSDGSRSESSSSSSTGGHFGATVSSSGVSAQSHAASSYDGLLGLYQAPDAPGELLTLPARSSSLSSAS